jgi:hypothetical protein
VLHTPAALQNADTRVKQDFGVALAEGQYVWNHPNDTYNATQEALGAAYYYYTHCADLGKVAADVLTGVTFTAATAYIARPLFEDLPLGCGCFPSDTMVDTPKGGRAIDTLKVGDQVLAKDPATGKVEAEPIQAVIDDGIKPLMAVGLSDGSSLKVTTNHPFYVDQSAVRVQAGWVQAGNLRLGDRLRAADLQDVTIVGLRYSVGYVHVYTLTVAHDHDFFVGTAQVLAHDCEVRTYDPGPSLPGGKHGPGGWGTLMDLDPVTAQQVLQEAISVDGKKQLYGYYEGKIYEFQPDNAGTYHGYPIPGDQAPTGVLRELRNSGKISNAEYNKLRRGK